MSGKAPPRGPRALLNSLQPSQASTSKLPATSSAPAGPKTNAAPPTGPRSLMNGGGGLGSRFPALNAGLDKVPMLVNGHTLRVPPSGPKMKSVDFPSSSSSSRPPSGTAVASSSTWVNGKRPPTGPSALRASGASKQHPARPPSPSAPSERESSHPPPPPTPLGRAPTIPPPPPPPASPPPIPPPPADVPHLSTPIKLPTTQPQEPRLVPPPLPPPPSLPQPPSLAPPPLPPHVPPTHFLPKAPISFRLDPRNGRPPTQTFAPKSSVLSPPPPPPPAPPSLPPPPPPLPTVSSPRPPSPPLPPQVFSFTRLIDGKLTKLYSLRPPPPYPPARTQFPEGRDFKVLYDGLCDKDRITFSTGESLSAKSLIETLRSRGATDRIKEVNKGKAHLIYRYFGEYVGGEPRPVPSDPRKVSGSKRVTRIREEFHSLAYEHDQNSPGPPPPTNVLIIGLPPLTTNAQLRTLFGKYGSVQSFDREIDRKNGAQLGILSIRYSTHEEARRCVTAEDHRTFAESAKAAGLTITSLNMTMGKKEEHEEMRVVFDGDGKKLKAVLDEIDKRQKAEKDRKSQGSKALQGTTEVNGSAISKASAISVSINDILPPGQISWSGAVPSPFSFPFNHGIPGLPPRPQIPQRPRNMLGPPSSQNARKLAPSFWRARAVPDTTFAITKVIRREDASNSPGVGRISSESTPAQSILKAPRTGLGGHRVSALSQVETPTQESTPLTSRSPSPVSRRRDASSRMKEEQDAAHAKVLEELRGNGNDYILIEETQLGGSSVKEEDIRWYFAGLKADKVLHDHNGWYITFATPDAASRAERVLGMGSRLLANRSVTMTVQSPPKSRDAEGVQAGSPSKEQDTRTWSREEMLAEAEEMIVKELKSLLEKDVTDRVVGTHIRKMALEERNKREPEAAAQSTREEAFGAFEFTRGLKGLSFRKRKQEVHIAVPATPDPDPEHEAEPEPAPTEVSISGSELKPEQERLKIPEVDKLDDAATVVPSPEISAVQHEHEEVSDAEERPKKRRRNSRSSADLELEGETVPVYVQHASRETSPTIVAPASETAVKRPPSPALSEEQPSKRPRLDVQIFSEPEVIPEPEPQPAEQLPTPPSHEPVEKVERKDGKTKKSKKGEKAERTKKTKVVVLDEAEEFVIPPQPSIDAPPIAEIRVDPSIPWTPSTPPSTAASLLELKSPGGSRIKPLSESALKDLAVDDEDLYFLKLALSHEGEFDENYVVSDVTIPPSDPDSPPPFRKHVTGSARTEGYYKISHAEKSAYVAQYALRNSTAEGPAEAEPTPQVVVSSRSNRANARRRAQGLEEINQLQLAVALSKGETGAADVVKFNQLQTRKKHLRFARSPIHDWGLYAMERIGRGEMVIEYVGEIIRAAVADKREKAYERQGIGSSYLFRIDEELVADATKKGNLGRLINHSCDPNCTAKIITINGEKKIVIYAKQDIELGDEITYDYHFPIEQDKIPCLCGSAKCRGFLN